MHSSALMKLSMVVAVVVNIASVVALPEAMSLGARQGPIECLAEPCDPVEGCCGNAVCTPHAYLGLPGVCTPATCDVICSTTADCCTDVYGSTFTCQLLDGQSVGVCIPQ
ncbi:hypothetical protein BD309DRAFT_981164 [Dichomitus squalens]|uniref:Uncharacterized protein n=1 Tax=Dichomitus squalens TaxID=114155 RepID=A0A4Q9NPK1_9APHY|nr:hypothetical protein BD309DRAFT_981164 [Dichomitus squalens]TBU52919.1 hypothetical protein BD310DRAFT_909824 [Dichomitus squalens]